MIPTQASSTRCPILGVAHFPRLFEKYALTATGDLTKGYELGGGYDAMTEQALGIDRAAALKFVEDEGPDYLEFIQWVRKNGKVDAAAIEAHNAAVDGYVHSDETAAGIRQEIGLTPELEAELLGVEGGKLQDLVEQSRGN
jgi:Domain of unknown function (DUF5069)